MSWAVTGLVDPDDSEVIFEFLLMHFQGCDWDYLEPDGHDTYDQLDVMIMCRWSHGHLLEYQARQLIAQYGCADTGRLPIATFGRLRVNGLLDNVWAPDCKGSGVPFAMDAAGRGGLASHGGDAADLLGAPEGGDTEAAESARAAAGAAGDPCGCAPAP